MATLTLKNLVVLATVLYQNVIPKSCQITTILPDKGVIEQDEVLVNCLINILEKYYAGLKGITYYNINAQDDAIIRATHSLNLAPVIYRDGSEKVLVWHEAYLIVADNVEHFVHNFDHLVKEELWNPYVRFLIVIRSLHVDKLKSIFIPLLKFHVNNVLLVNGTEDADLYTYNPFENYACGKYFERVISYGQCLHTTEDLFPNKFVTGLRNCTFFASVPHRAPYALDPSLIESGEATIGAEQHVFKILADLEGFKVHYKYNYGKEVFTKVYPNMTAVGPFEILQKNETDVIFGGTMLAASQIYAFTVLYGHLEFYDSFMFVVKKAAAEPTWKIFYLEFNWPVWTALAVGWLLYSIIMMVLLRTEDKSAVMMKLLDTLLQHGYHFKCRGSVKCVLIVWMWFAFLINVFYQSSLVSLTMYPAVEYQPSSEEDLKTYNIKACMNPNILNYVLSENPNHSYTIDQACTNTPNSMDVIKNSKQHFTLIGRSAYEYNLKKFYDKWGNPSFYLFKEYYAKIMNVMFFYKGFPVSHRLRSNIIRVRESGLMIKYLEDQFYSRKIQKRIIDKDYEARFGVPWLIFTPGCVVATIVFVIEVLIGNKKNDEKSERSSAITTIWRR